MTNFLFYSSCFYPAEVWHTLSKGSDDQTNTCSFFSDPNLSAKLKLTANKIDLGFQYFLKWCQYNYTEVDFIISKFVLVLIHFLLWIAYYLHTYICSFVWFNVFCFNLVSFWMSRWTRLITFGVGGRWRHRSLYFDCRVRVSEIRPTAESDLTASDLCWWWWRFSIIIIIMDTVWMSTCYRTTSGTEISCWTLRGKNSRGRSDTHFCYVILHEYIDSVHNTKKQCTKSKIFKIKTFLFGVICVSMHFMIKLFFCGLSVVIITCFV